MSSSDPLSSIIDSSGGGNVDGGDNDGDGGGYGDLPDCKGHKPLYGDRDSQQKHEPGQDVSKGLNLEPCILASLVFTAWKIGFVTRGKSVKMVFRVETS